MSTPPPPPRPPEDEPPQQPGGWQPQPPPPPPPPQGPPPPQQPGGWQPQQPPPPPPQAPPQQQPGGWQPNPPGGYQQPYQQGQYQPSWAGGPAYAGMAVAGALAGFWRRLLAVIIDGIILGVVVQIINGIIAAASGGMINDGAGYTRGTLFELVLGILYFGYMWSQYGKTLGYMALGIRLVREDGAPVSFVLGAGRWVMIWLSFQLCVIPAIVSAFMIGFGQQKKAIHDYIVGTLVVHG